MPNDLMRKHYWYKDEKRTKHNVLLPFLISNTNSQHSVWSYGFQSKNFKG